MFGSLTSLTDGGRVGGVSRGKEGGRRKEAKLWKKERWLLAPKYRLVPHGMNSLVLSAGEEGRGGTAQI